MDGLLIPDSTVRIATMSKRSNLRVKAIVVETFSIECECGGMFENEHGGWTLSFGRDPGFKCGDCGTYYSSSLVRNAINGGQAQV